MAGAVVGTVVGTVVVASLSSWGLPWSRVEGIFEGTVVVGTVVGVVGTAVVVVVTGTVVVVVVVGTSVAGVLAEPLAPLPGDAGAVMVTVAQTPACSSVATSFDEQVRERFSAASSDVSVTAAWVTALAASSRCCCGALKASLPSLSRSIRSAAATPRYCCATTPSWVLRSVRRERLGAA